VNTKLRLASAIAAVAIVAAACGGASATPAPSAAPAGLNGAITLWHSYGSGGGEGTAFLKALKVVQDANPGLKVTVVEQPFSDIFKKWETDVAAGGGADMFIAPNDNLGSEARAGVLADLTTALTGKLDGFAKVAVDGSKVDGKMYMVPESLKAVAMWYDKTVVTAPPTTTDALLAAVKSGAVKLGLNQSAYHMFGFSGGFGGSLMDATGKCTADQGGFADAFKYFVDLKAAGAKFYTDGNAIKQDFQTGKLNAVIDGPWQTADFTKALPDKLAVAPIPAGPKGKANPLTGTDGWYINPNSKNLNTAVALALALVATASEQVLTDGAGHVPAAPGVTISSDIVKGFAAAAADGLPRPQSAQFNNFWGPFGDAVNAVLDKASDPTTTVASACKLMNDANKIK
jgi:arabinogalactan oligomer/maltooligosaccharide transport system substrate-binding protein